MDKTTELRLSIQRWAPLIIGKYRADEGESSQKTEIASDDP